MLSGLDHRAGNRHRITRTEADVLTIQERARSHLDSQRFARIGPDIQEHPLHGGAFDRIGPDAS